MHLRNRVVRRCPGRLKVRVSCLEGLIYRRLRSAQVLQRRRFVTTSAPGITGSFARRKDTTVGRRPNESRVTCSHRVVLNIHDRQGNEQRITNGSGKCSCSCFVKVTNCNHSPYQFYSNLATGCRGSHAQGVIVTSPSPTPSNPSSMHS